jgi:hypothetical protein
MNTKQISLAEFEQMVLKAIKENNIENVRDYVVEFKKWKTYDYFSFYLCIYIGETNGNNHSGYAETPTAAISQAIASYESKNKKVVYSQVMDYK